MMRPAFSLRVFLFSSSKTRFIRGPPADVPILSECHGRLKSSLDREKGMLTLYKTCPHPRATRLRRLFITLFICTILRGQADREHVRERIVNGAVRSGVTVHLDHRRNAAAPRADPKRLTVPISRASKTGPGTFGLFYARRKPPVATNEKAPAHAPLYINKA